MYIFFYCAISNLSVNYVIIKFNPVKKSSLQTESFVAVYPI